MGILDLPCINGTCPPGHCAGAPGCVRCAAIAQAWQERIKRLAAQLPAGQQPDPNQTFKLPDLKGFPKP